MHPWYILGKVSLTSATYGDSVGVFFVAIIAQTDIGEIEDLSGWLKKLSLEQLRFE